MKVQKRDGSLEKFDAQKIKRAINWACEGLSVEPLRLECLVDEVMYDGIPTSKIHANVIEKAKGLSSASESDWVKVAGRLLTMKMWSENNSYEDSFEEFVWRMKKEGYYNHPAFDKYNTNNLRTLGAAVVPNRDLDHSYSSVVTAVDKYLLPKEPIQYMFMAQALIIASVEKTTKDRINQALEIYEWLSLRKISLATPWLSNLRSNKNIASCFILGANDNIDSIFNTAKYEALISKEGGGVGIFLGALRAKGSWLMGMEGNATGVIGWCKIFNDIALYVNQGGKRKGAATLALPIWHADVLDFLDIQTEAGDQRQKSHDIQPQLTIPDLFMEMKDDPNAVWHMFCPYEVEKYTGEKLWDKYGEDWRVLYKRCVDLHYDGKLKVVRKIKAKELMIKWMKTLFETGLPYGFFVDEVNRQNPNNHVGMIYCGNLCQESYSVFKLDETAHTCSLASIVVGRVPMDELSAAGAMCTRILDNGLELTKPPIELSKSHMDSLRTIGVGIQGYHDIVAREGKSYYDYEFLGEVMDRISYGVISESIGLAAERGAYPEFKGSKWWTGEKIEQYARLSKNPEKWEELQVLCDKYGIRNSQLISPAPNTSTSLFMDASAGVLPAYSPFFLDQNKSGTLPVACMYLKENPISYYGSFDTHKPWKLAEFVGEMQQYVDTGISSEYLMDKNQEGFNAKWLWDTLQSAWVNKTKAVYYVRTLKVGEKLVGGQSESDCDACAG